MGQRLGRGHLDTGISRYDNAVAVDRLMTVILERHRPALRALADGVPHPASRKVARRLSPKSAPQQLIVYRTVPTSALAEWAATYRLASPIIYEWAYQTVENWAAHPDWKADLKWATPQAPKQTLDIWKGHTSELPDDPLAPVGAMPEVELEDEFKDRAAALWKARADALTAQGAKAVSMMKNLDHFDWLVRYQFGDETFTAIAAEETRDVTTLRDAIVALAERLQIPLRPAAKGKRPR